jgi:hypothetical protein
MSSAGAFDSGPGSRDGTSLILAIGTDSGAQHDQVEGRTRQVAEEGRVSAAAEVGAEAETQAAQEVKNLGLGRLCYYLAQDCISASEHMGQGFLRLGE